MFPAHCISIWDLSIFKGLPICPQRSFRVGPPPQHSTLHLRSLSIDLDRARGHRLAECRRSHVACHLWPQVHWKGKLLVLGTLGGSGHKHRHVRTPETKWSPASGFLLTLTQIEPNLTHRHLMALRPERTVLYGKPWTASREWAQNGHRSSTDIFGEA